MSNLGEVREQLGRIVAVYVDEADTRGLPGALARVAATAATVHVERSRHPEMAMMTTTTDQVYRRPQRLDESLHARWCRIRGGSAPLRSYGATTGDEIEVRVSGYDVCVP